MYTENSTLIKELFPICLYFDHTRMHNNIMCPYIIVCVTFST